MTLILTQEEVRGLLDMPTCMDLMESALAALALGQAQNPLRRGLLLPDGESLVGMMPGSMTTGSGTASPDAIGLKVVVVYPKNHGTPYDSHQGVVMLFDPADGRPTVILDGSEVTAIRTAAASGVATRLLAREGASTLALLGSGVQARTHLEAMACARDVREVRVFSPNPESRSAFARREADRHGLAVRAVGSAAEAVDGADLVCTTSSSKEPILKGEWIAPGTHVNAVGACVPKARELDTDAVARARVFVDCRESAMNESGDLLIPIQEGALTEEHLLGEISDLLLERVEGRTADDDITVFKSLGIAVEDLAAATHVLRRAREEGVGTEVALGGLKDA